MGKRLLLVLCIVLVLPAGCGTPLSKSTAEGVIEDALRQRKAAGMPALTEGAIDVQVGDIHAASVGDCQSVHGQPVELAELERYSGAQVIQLDRPEPCKWVVTLAPQTQRDIVYDDRFKPPSLRDYNTVAIALSQWDSFAVTHIQQDGLTANVEATASFRFTPTMMRLARFGVFPPLQPGCAYDSRHAFVRCTRTLPMTFAAGGWHLDFDKL